MTILKSITKSSNIKLHTKLIKSLLKDNFYNLLKDPDNCLLIEVLRNDVFLKTSSEKSKKSKTKKKANTPANND